MIKTLKPYLKKYKLVTILAPLAIIIEVMLEIRIPLLMSKIIDVGIATSDMSYVLKTGGLMILFSLIGLICGGAGSIFGAKAGMGFGSEVRKGVFEKVQEFSFSNIDKFSTASLVTRLTSDITNTQNTFVLILRIAVRAPVMLVSATIMAYSINHSLVSVFYVAIPFLTIALIFIGYLTYPRFRALLKKYDSLNAIVQENLVNIRVVKSFVRAKFEKEKFKEVNDGLMNTAIRAEKVIVFVMPIMQLAMYGCITAILWFGGKQVISGTMLTGQLISFISYVSQILLSLMLISMIFINLILSRASVARIIEILNEKIDISDEFANKNLEVEDGTIIFKNVNFKYDKNSQTNVLEDINISIKSGERIGILGGTGSAKTTLVQLIPRLYDTTEGEVIVGGHNVREYTLEHLRNAVSMVLQKNVLFSGTIKENLKWGDEKATDEQIIQACKNAQAHDFIMSFPEQYNTDLGQGGVNVSGGQKQRLCIARALLKKPKIIILDDSTSAVDTATDSKIREALDKNLKNTTVIIIAQRITSIDTADKIIVLEDGKINAIGTPEELLKTNEIYQEIYNSQLKGAE